MGEIQGNGPSVTDFIAAQLSEGQKPKAQRPTVGRAVHYTPRGEHVEGVILHATIAAVNDDGTVNLSCLTQNAETFPRLNAEQGEDFKAGQPCNRGKWSWPARV